MDETQLKDNIDQHKAYIQSWISVLKNEPNELFAAIKDADKITDYLFEQGKLLELGMSDSLAQAHQEGEQPEQESGEEMEL